MSLYTCIDLLDYKLDELSKEGLVLADQEFLNNLKEQLNQRIADDNYTDFSADIGLIRSYLEKNQNTKIEQCLKLIRFDLQKIDSDVKHAEIVSSILKYLNIVKLKVNLPDYKKFQTPEYLIAPIEQSRLVKMGTSSGYCYGFTYSMVNPKLSPYKNPSMNIDLNQDVHNYHTSQGNRQKDQQSIKRTRLTRIYFCPDAQQQARHILNFAETNKGKELALILSRKVGGHACYLSVQDDGNIRYMDPNYGAFLFHRASDFIDLYVAAAQAGYAYHFYYLSEMNYDEKEQLTESKTWQGKIRTLLTGPKYHDRSLSWFPLAIATVIFNLTLSAGIGWGIGSILGATIGSVVPILGTAVGAEVGGLLGAMLGVLAGEILSMIAIDNNYHGLLGIPHMLQEHWHRFKEKRASSVLASSSKTNDSKAVAMNESSINCSTSTLLSLFDVDSPAQQTVVADEVVISTERQQNRSISVVSTSPREFFKRITAEPIDQTLSPISISL
ncbi:MAG: hypothetical protein LEGION0403_FIIPPAGN_02575 [Legionella sp.]|uniref:hypothetical protein n=1 Tax=Legionella sp. TaxID=459 RepID=UPI003D0E73A7